MSSWVIGGTSGIGAAISARLQTMGIKTYATGEKVDVRDYTALEKQLQDICEEGGDQDRLQSVFYCAGINYLEWVGQLELTGQQQIMDMLEVNVGGFISTMDLLARFWWREELFLGDGLSVCAISSDAAERPMRTSIGYCASKAALNTAVKVAARELGPRGWRVFGVAPGMIGHEMLHDFDPARSQMTEYVDEWVPRVREWTPLEARGYESQQAVVKRPLRINPHDVAWMAVELAMSGFDHINGGIYTVNGGR